MRRHDSISGENPFERLLRERRATRPSPTGNYKMDKIHARMLAAQAQAEKQRQLGDQVILSLAPKVIEDPVEDTITTARAESTSLPAGPTGRQAWVSLWTVIWVALTLVMMAGNVVGGLIVSVPLFFVCIFIANAPRLYAGTFADGVGRANNGTAV